jgi:DUF1680 family protein
VVVERGPEVLCVESVDLGADVSAVAIDLAAGVRESDGRVLATLATTQTADSPWPYGPTTPPATATTTEVPLIAYHDWANRGPSTMRVWIPVV